MIDTTVRGSRDWWLSTLADRLMHENRRIATLDAYLTGNAPLPEGMEGFRQAYRDFQKQSRTNFAELIVEAVQERMTPAGFRVSGDDTLDDAAAAVWSLNELDVVSSDIHYDMLAFGRGYSMVDTQEGVPIITREDPAKVITAHDPLRPNRVIAALKMYRDDVAGTEHAWLYLPGLIQRYVRDARDASYAGTLSTDAGGFEPDGTIDLGGDRLPVVCFKNQNGVGEFETHTDIIDRINYMVLQRLVITAMQAFRQRAIIGDMPATDEAGQPIPYNDIFRPGPGALWLPGSDVTMWESSATDIQPLLTAVKDDVRNLSAVTRTPIAMLMPEGENQSAEGASFAREGLIFKTQDRIKRATYGWNTTLALALGLRDSSAIETLWAPAERMSLAERSDAATKLANVLPWRTLVTSVLQYSPAEAERMESERLSDVLTLALGEPQQ